MGVFFYHLYRKLSREVHEQMALSLMECPTGENGQADRILTESSAISAESGLEFNAGVSLISLNKRAAKNSRLSLPYFPTY